jgi:hypothetical protein
MLHETRRFVSCAESKRALIASGFSFPQSDRGRFLSDATYASESGTTPWQGKAGVKRLTPGTCVFVCIAAASGLRGTQKRSFAVATANPFRVAAGSC